LGTTKDEVDICSFFEHSLPNENGKTSSQSRKTGNAAQNQHANYLK
jgi:hypothetical protein